VEDLYPAASERPDNDRATLLTEACNGDDDLRRAVEDLLQQSDSPESFLKRPGPLLLDRSEFEPGHSSSDGMTTSIATVRSAPVTFGCFRCEEAARAPLACS
jgi:hypothetical protein